MDALQRAFEQERVERADTRRWDVVIVEIGTGAVAVIAGDNMRRDATHDSAERRLRTVLGRINDRHFVDIVPHGRYRVGDIHEPEPEPRP